MTTPSIVRTIALILPIALAIGCGSPSEKGGDSDAAPTSRPAESSAKTAPETALASMKIPSGPEYGTGITLNTVDEFDAVMESPGEFTDRPVLVRAEVMDVCNPLDIPVGPILSMKELAEEPSLRETGTIVEVDHPERGPYLSVGCPIKMSDSPVEVVRSPLLGEHTEEILSEVLGYSDSEVAEIKESGAV